VIQYFGNIAHRKNPPCQSSSLLSGETGLMMTRF
jgi:hypothetical protein